MDYQFSERISSLAPSAIREMFKYASVPGVISLALGNPSSDSFPVDYIRKAVGEILEETPLLALEYNNTEGYEPLRQSVKAMMKSRYDIGRDFDDVIITSGAQQGCDMACKVLCNEGDTVICEEPSFIGALNTFRSYKLNLVGVPLLEDGVDIEKLEEAFRSNPNAKLFYVIPTFQNPTGITTSAEKRKAIYDLAVKYGIMIVEDNPYSELRFTGDNIPPIKTLDEKGIVIYLGSFSKILSPGMRVGYMVCGHSIIEKVTIAKQVADAHSNILAQVLCDKFLKELDFDQHIARIRDIYRHKCTLMLDRLDAELPAAIHHTKPEGGLFVWCTLPDDINAVEFCTTSVKDYKVAIVPGSTFNTDEKAPSHCFRLNFSTASDEKIVEGLARLGKLAHQIIN